MMKCLYVTDNLEPRGQYTKPYGQCEKVWAGQKKGRMLHWTSSHPAFPVCCMFCVYDGGKFCFAWMLEESIFGQLGFRLCLCGFCLCSCSMVFSFTRTVEQTMQLSTLFGSLRFSTCQCCSNTTFIFKHHTPSTCDWPKFSSCIIIVIATVYSDCVVCICLRFGDRRIKRQKLQKRYPSIDPLVRA